MATAMAWRVCTRYPRFEVSEYGDVRLIGGRRLRGFIDFDGYIRYALTGAEGKRGVPAHQLVAEAFIGPRPTPDHEVAHENGSRIYCHFSNLRWSLSVDNHADRITHGTDPKGERNGRAVVDEAGVRDIRRLCRERARVMDIAELYGISVGQVYRIASGQAWPHVPMENYKDRT